MVNTTDSTVAKESFDIIGFAAPKWIERTQCYDRLHLYFINETSRAEERSDTHLQTETESNWNVWVWRTREYGQQKKCSKFYEKMWRLSEDSATRAYSCTNQTNDLTIDAKSIVKLRRENLFKLLSGSEN